MNFYMAWGGTKWGDLAAPVVCEVWCDGFYDVKNTTILCSTADILTYGSFGSNTVLVLYLEDRQIGEFAFPGNVSHRKFTTPTLSLGVVNNRGANTLAVSLWTMSDAGATLDTVGLFAYGVYESDSGFARDGSVLQPGWTKSRLQYA